MTTDEKVELACKLAEELRIKRSEWQRWANYFIQKRDLARALKLAEHLSNSPALRADPKTAAKAIYQVINKRLPELQLLSESDLAEVFGYVSRHLEWLNFIQKGSHEKSSPGHTRRSPSGRH